jgi:putative Ca2+/H+ antiporter (TMEM165/GDT1 family)
MERIWNISKTFSAPQTIALVHKVINEKLSVILSEIQNFAFIQDYQSVLFWKAFLVFAVDINLLRDKNMSREQLIGNCTKL